MQKSVLLIVLFLMLSAAGYAQNDSGNHLGTERAQSVYFEILGPGILYSGNYDTRFQDTPNGLGGRIGASFISIDDESLFTLPVMINYLLGREGKYFEIGLGATYLRNNDNGDIIFEETDDIIGTMVFGYRSQPIDGGFMFRAGFAPIFSEGDFIPYYPYLSLGYTF